MSRGVLRPGKYVWIECQVKPGPFANERMVKAVSVKGQEWLGFVPSSELKEPEVKSGSNYIKGLVLTVQGKYFHARLPGAPISTAQFAGEISQAELIA